MIFIALSVFDKKGKEVYFTEDPTGIEYCFEKVKEVIKTHSTWTINTDDYGYFYRAFEESTLNYDDQINYWKKYYNSRNNK